MMKTGLKSLMFLTALAAAQTDALAGADHPALSAADEAYSAERYEEAAALYRRDAEFGIVAAQVNLAFLYMDGQGVAQDYKQAALWFTRAAERGHREAQQNLGVLCRDGKGVAQDSVEAYKWFLVAGAASDAVALEKQMTPEQVADAKRRADAWRAKFKGAGG